MKNVGFQAVNYQQKSIYLYADRVADALQFKPADNIDNIVRRLGGTLEYVSYEKYEDTKDGSIDVRGNKDFTIFVSNTNNYIRNRFTIAHEIGHYILHSKFGSIKGKAQRFPSVQQANFDIEIEANWFAASFLMPKQYFENTYQSGLLKNASKFAVSLETAEYRYDVFSKKKF